jgi:hypothetical protein
MLFVMILSVIMLIVAALVVVVVTIWAEKIYFKVGVAFLIAVICKITLLDSQLTKQTQTQFF